MRDLQVGALPVYGDDGRLNGIITDRDIVIRCVVGDTDPQNMTVGDLGLGEPFTVEADADVSEVLRVKEDHRIRRLPVMQGRRLVGIISEADVARNLPDESVAEFIETICGVDWPGLG
jgi:CBS domain-containing protein